MHTSKRFAGVSPRQITAVPGSSFRVTGSARVRACARVRNVQVQAQILDVASINQRLEARAKALIDLEEQEKAYRPKVRFILQNKVNLGECWKVCGSAPELGRFKPEVAPYLKWTPGDKWILEIPFRPGTHTFKAVLRRADGAYVWEEGENRVLEVPYGAGAGDVIEVKIGIKQVVYA